MSLLQVKNVTFRYPDTSSDTLHDINLNIAPGEFISIVGPSGSGKSSLLRLLAAHLSPTSGQILFNGEEMEGPDIRLVPGYEEIKLVFQQFELAPNLSVRENIRVMLKDYESDYRDERTADLLSFFSLDAIASHQPRQISGGQQQRLAIARAMATEPEVLLLDEPFSALDPMNSAIFIKEIRRLAAEMQTAVILVTHDTRDAMMADRVAVLMNGQLMQVDSPSRVYHRPASEEVAHFFGPVNKLDAQTAALVGLEARECFVRAEDVGVSESPDREGFEVEDVIFRGAYHILIVDIHGVKLLIFDFERKYGTGSKVSVHIEQKNLIHFA